MNFTALLRWIDTCIPDVITHFLLILIVTLISGWQAGAWVAVTIELMQWLIFGIAGREWDTVKDLAVDAAAVLLGHFYPFIILIIKGVLQ